ncbi:MAG: hypothetical protein KC776_04670 [Myxococcales bacterium]|nr:hypothetical protein [Myxococcales bacterium]MCB9579077.1 hypothetical protein [Polyangiaceae bacterium]
MQQVVHQPSSGIELQAKHSFLQWMLMFVSPVVMINGQKVTARWGNHFIPLAAGQYDVMVYFPWFFQQANKARSAVTVYDGHVTGLSYSTAFLTFMSGSLRDLGSRPFA